MAVPALLKKLDQLEKFTADEKHSRQDIIAKIIKFKQWAVGDRSLLEHRLCFSFMQYLYNSYGQDFEDFLGFRSWLQCRCGMAQVQTKEIEKDGKLRIYQKYLVESLAFGNCTQKRFHEFFKNVQQFAFKVWGIKFEEWEVEYKQNTNTIQ